MKKIITTACTALTILFAHAQNKVKLENFNRLVIEEPVAVNLIKSSEPGADADNNKINFIVKNNTLYLEIESLPKLNSKVNIYYTQLNSIEIDGIGSVETAANDVLETDYLQIHTEGIAKVSLNLKTNQINLKGEGTGSITLTGNSRDFFADIEGALKLNAANLKTNTTEINADGACNFDVNASEKLTISAEGMNRGTYTGNPPTTNIKVTGLSKVKNAENGQEFADNRNNGNAGDTTKIKIGKRKFIITPEYEEIKKDNKNRKPFKNVYSGFELGVQQLTQNSLNTTMPPNYEFLSTNPAKSWFYGLNIWEDDLHIIKNKLALTTGFGLEFSHLGFDNNRMLKPNNTKLNADSNAQPLTLNRLYNFNASIPLLIKFAPNTGKRKNNGFHLAAGVIGSYCISIKHRAESAALGYEQEWISHDDFNINPFRLSATIRAGYGWFRVFANYNLTPYFKRTNTDNIAGNAPDFRIATLGITVIPF